MFLISLNFINNTLQLLYPDTFTAVNMRAATIFAIISGASALSIRAECPTASGSACGVVEVLGQTVGYPKCDCQTTCSGPVSVSGISATVVSFRPRLDDNVFQRMSC